MTLREQFIKSAVDTCQYFNGIQNKTCKAGVPYQPASKDLAMPCIPRFINNRETWPCELFSIMSQAEAEKEADERIESVERTTKARKAAKDDATTKGLKKGHGGASSVTCPCCNGTLRYSVAAYNGHMHARCSTQGCVSWME